MIKDMRLPLHKLLRSFHFVTRSEKGTTAHQLHRGLGITYKTRGGSLTVSEKLRKLL